MKLLLLAAIFGVLLMHQIFFPDLLSNHPKYHCSPWTQKSIILHEKYANIGRGVQLIHTFFENVDDFLPLDQIPTIRF